MDAQQTAELQNMPPTGVDEASADKRCNEVVKRKSKRHEYVEVDGFHFRRKRRAPPTPLAGAAAANAAAVGCIAGAEASNQSPVAIKHSLQLDRPAQSSPAKTAPSAADNDAAMADQDAHATRAAGTGKASPAEASSQDDPADTAAALAASPGTEADPAAAPEQVAAAKAAAAATAAAATAAEAVASAAAAEAAAAAAAAEAAAADLEMVEASEDPSEQGLDQTAGPIQITMLPSELCHLVGSFLAAELHKLPGGSPASAQRAADSIKQQLAQRLQQQTELAGSADAAAGSSQAKEPAGAAAAAPALQAVPSLTVLPHQMEELKAKLMDKHNKLLQEQEAWVQLLAQYNDMAHAAPAAAAAEVAEAPGSAPHQQQDQDLNGQAADAAQEAGTAAAALADGAAADPTGAPGGGVGVTDGPVCAQQEESLLGVQLKVDVLTALVAKMEHLVGRAEATARALQAGYRAEKFSIFPHVDSPATLIKSLARSSQATGDNQ